MTDAPKRIYIASPYWHPHLLARYENVLRQIHLANALIDLGYSPFWPLHAHYTAQIGTGRMRPEARWLELSMGWIPACDILLRVPLPSPGADAEEARARDLGMPVIHDIPALISLQEGGDPNARSSVHP